MDEDIHFGPVTLTKDGTAVIASFDAINPVTGETTPMSILLPGATSTDAGVMDASSVAWITEAEERISALEGLSDVKALVGLSATPTQTEINAGWMGEVGKAPETGDFVQDVSNSKLWVYVNDTWVLYGNAVTVPLATTSSVGGVKDTALDAPGNRWYSHVEADGRLSLIGGDALSTLLDTTIPGISTHVSRKDNPHTVTKTQVGLGSYPTSPADIGVSTATQTALDGTVKKTGDTMTGALYANGNINIVRSDEGIITYKRLDVGYNTAWGRFKRELVYDKDDLKVGESVITCTNGNTAHNFAAITYKDDGTPITNNFTIRAYATGECFVETPMRAKPGASDAVNYRRLLDAYDEMVDYFNEQIAIRDVRIANLNVDISEIRSHVGMPPSPI